MTRPIRTATPAALAIGAALTAATPAQTQESSIEQAGPGPYVVQFVRFESSLSREEVLRAAAKRKPMFEAMPGLVQKYYLELDAPNSYGGIYIWESAEAMAAFRQSEEFKTIPAAYGIATPPEVEIISSLYSLR